MVPGTLIDSVSSCSLADSDNYLGAEILGSWKIEFYTVAFPIMEYVSILLTAPINYFHSQIPLKNVCLFN